VPSWIKPGITLPLPASAGLVKLAGAVRRLPDQHKAGIAARVAPVSWVSVVVSIAPILLALMRMTEPTLCRVE
jgi:hypothetical protein